jgi:hypothetical protein
MKLEEPDPKVRLMWLPPNQRYQSNQNRLSNEYRRCSTVSLTIVIHIGTRTPSRGLVTDKRLAYGPVLRTAVLMIYVQLDGAP